MQQLNAKENYLGVISHFIYFFVGSI